ncbi:ribosomal protein S18-alanine N-acetyltransferase [Acetobacter farinalis]|uniref:[Ribosomal protein bS18]-alanine N-acetyltransferase n=1 Tax=Acetobacter farinalis TaxID=1260984 RepID=A0ABT3Q5R0_9PROT|nr:ribosomal protein S18-alanine N-acetyltransferase [Acetobacter farinalis]MCX2560607.1 ribosomal protein S18-alanine N-acetyltransferase [Acetobacter farinalis]
MSQTFLPAVRIIEAGQAHGAVLAALHAQSFSAADVWDEAALTQLLPMAGVVTGLALQGEEPAGFLMLRCVADEAEILTVCVAQAFRQRGIARQLLAWSLMEAQERDADHMFLEVSVRNKVAQALYAGAGFVQAGKRRAYYPDGSDALVLMRSWDV